MIRSGNAATPPSSCFDAASFDAPSTKAAKKLIADWGATGSLLVVLVAAFPGAVLPRLVDAAGDVRGLLTDGHLHAAGVPCAPIQDMPLGHHLNFTDPDGIALELQAPNAVYAAALVELRGTLLSDDEVRERAARLLAAPGGSGSADSEGRPDR